MKSLIKWIFFVPVFLLSVVLMLFVSITPQTVTGLFATDINGIAELISFGVLGLFVVCYIVSLFDRHSSPIFVLGKNVFAGACGVLTAFALAATAALDVANFVQMGVYDVVDIVTAVFTLLAAVSMLFIGLNHISGSNSAKPVAVLYLSLPLWCGVHLIDRFMEHTAEPVAAAETLDLVLFVILAMFFIYITMIHAMIPAKNTVKNAVTFGFPSAVIAFVFCISQISAALTSEAFVPTDIIPALSYGFIGLYAISFTAQISSKAKSDYEQKVITFDAYDEEFDEDEESDEAQTDDAQNDVTVTVTDDEPADVQPDEDLAVEAEEEVKVAPTMPRTVVRVVEDDPDEEEAVAQELFSAAKLNDENKATDIDEVLGSDDSMIIDGDNSVNVSVEEPAVRKPKGPTTREAIVLDDDFILGVDGGGLENLLPEDDDEDDDISSFILEKTTPAYKKERAKGNRNSRLDEIDRLIISIQGGDADDEKSE